MLRVDRREDNFLLGSSYRTACPGGPAPHQGCSLLPPLPAAGLDLPGLGPSTSSSPPQGLCTCYAFYLELPLSRSARDLLSCRPQATHHLLRTLSWSLRSPKTMRSPTLAWCVCFRISPLPQSDIAAELFVVVSVALEPCCVLAPGTQSRCSVNSSELTSLPPKAQLLKLPRLTHSAPIPLSRPDLAPLLLPAAPCCSLYPCTNSLPALQPLPRESSTRCTFSSKGLPRALHTGQP